MMVCFWPAADRRRVTPLGAACEAGNTRASLMLLSFGADPLLESCAWAAVGCLPSLPLSTAQNKRSFRKQVSAPAQHTTIAGLMAPTRQVSMFRFGRQAQAIAEARSSSVNVEDEWTGGCAVAPAMLAACNGHFATARAVLAYVRYYYDHGGLALRGVLPGRVSKMLIRQTRKHRMLQPSSRETLHVRPLVVGRAWMLLTDASTIFQHACVCTAACNLQLLRSSLPL